MRAGACLAALLPLTLAACSAAGPEGGIDPSDLAQVARGEAVYRQHCAACHGAKLEGQADWRQRRPDGRLPAPPHDETGHTWHHTGELLINIVRDGMVPPWAPEGYQSDMPAYRGILGDADIVAVLAYIASRWPPDVRARWLQMQEQVRAQQGR